MMDDSPGVIVWAMVATVLAVAFGLLFLRSDAMRSEMRPQIPHVLDTVETQATRIQWDDRVWTPREEE